MKKIKIFLASSNELEAERRLFEIEIYRKCKLWFDKGVFLHLDIWEDLSASMAQAGSQSEYNRYVAAADLFIMLAHTKVGMYTGEEFENAFGSFKSTQKPFIFTYFKVSEEQVEESLMAFKSKLAGLKHFHSEFRNFDHLWNQFNRELDRLEGEGFTTNMPAKRIDTSLINIYDGQKKAVLGRLEKIYKLIDDYKTQDLTSNDPKERMKIAQALEALEVQKNEEEAEYQLLNSKENAK